MSDVTRRGFVKNSAGAAVGMSALAALLAERAAADGGGGEHAVVAWIGDPRSGEIAVMSAGGETTIRDRRLAARLAAAARTAA